MADSSYRNSGGAETVILTSTFTPQMEMRREGFPGKMNTTRSKG